jgi:hypothetical protein
MMRDKKPSKKSAKNSAETFQPGENKDVNELAKRALNTFLQHQIKEKAHNRQNIAALTETVQEFLNSFIILGYTMEGEPVQTIFAHNQQEADSLATLVNKFFTHLHSKEDSGDS